MGVLRRERVFAAPDGGVGRIYVASSRVTRRVKHVCVWDGDVWHVAPEWLLGDADGLLRWVGDRANFSV